MYERPILDPLPEIVSEGRFAYGTYAKPFGRTNMLDIERPYHHSVPRFIKRFRLKEWVAFYLGNSRYIVLTALYDAKIAALALFQGYDRETRQSFGFRRLLPGGYLRYGPSLDGSKVAYRSGRDLLAYDLDLSGGALRIRVNHRKTRTSPPLEGDLVLTWNDRQTAMQTVCLPLGLNRAMYSTKALCPMNGALRIGNETVDFSSSDSMGVLDDHKGYYPYRLRYDWAIGFGQDAKGRRVGFNLTDNPVKDPERDTENCMWVGGRTFPLPPVKVTRPRGIYEDWVIQDTEGQVDLIFHPETRFDIRLNLLAAQADYSGPFGSFKGFVRSGDGERIDASLVYGIGEKKYLRA